jgi:hypothetical protein
MHRHLPGRVFAALLLIWFAVISGEPRALHSCPVHDVPAHVGHAAAHAVHSHAPPPDGRGRATCTCIGDCNVGGFAPAIPSPRITIGAVATTRELRVAEPPLASALPAAAPFLLPYANGPPADRRVLV